MSAIEDVKSPTYLVGWLFLITTAVVHGDVIDHSYNYHWHLPPSQEVKSSSKPQGKGVGVKIYSQFNPGILTIHKV